MMKGARVVFAEPRVLEGVGAVDLVSIRKEEPEVAEGLVQDELEARKGILVSGGPSKVSDEGFVGSPGEGGRPR
jgi:hypothetical protein